MPFFVPNNGISKNSNTFLSQRERWVVSFRLKYLANQVVIWASDGYQTDFHILASLCFTANINIVDPDHKFLKLFVLTSSTPCLSSGLSWVEGILDESEDKIISKQNEPLCLFLECTGKRHMVLPNLFLKSYWCCQIAI
jgi:hypothetical protein